MTGEAQRQFIGRERELRLLEAAFSSGESAFLPVYGRRRVGKSELILRFMRGKPGVYFLGKQSAAHLQIREFLQEAAGLLAEPLLATFPAEGWKPAFQAVVSRWRRSEKLVLAFDEFQWMAEASPDLPSILQELWDREWKPSGRVVLIPCGSYVGFMEREVLGARSPLFGRRTGQILVKPFGYLEAGAFHPQYSLVDRARTYFICGGIPLYLRYFSEKRSVEANIAAALLEEYGPLHREPDFLLREELRDVHNYYGVLLAVAHRHLTNREISEQTGVGERSLHYYLKQLSDLGYLAQRYPLTGETPTARHVRYILVDPLLRFWFRFVYPNTSYLMQMGSSRTLADRIRPDLPSYLGSCFEHLCREALPYLYRKEGIAAACQVGEYWDKKTQIDVVGYRDDGWTDIGECKWGQIHGAAGIMADLEKKVACYTNPRNATIGRRVFTRQRLTPGKLAGKARWHCLEDLYDPALTDT